MIQLKDCTIENVVDVMNVERMEVGSMTVQNMHVVKSGMAVKETKVETTVEIDLAGMSFSSFDWINQNYTKEEKHKAVIDIRRQLLEGCSNYDKIIGKKLEIMGDVLRPLFLKRVINGLPKYAIAKKLFGDLPCLMNERNYAQLKQYVTTGRYDTIKG